MRVGSTVRTGDEKYGKIVNWTPGTLIIETKAGILITKKPDEVIHVCERCHFTLSAMERGSETCNACLNHSAQMIPGTLVRERHLGSATNGLDYWYMIEDADCPPGYRLAVDLFGGPAKSFPVNELVMVTAQEVAQVLGEPQTVS